MKDRSTCAVERPPVLENSFSKIPFGPVIRRLKPGSVKALAAVVRSSWVDPETRRRVSYATYRRLAELAGAADSQTIAKHLAELAEAGAVTIDTDDDGRRVVVVNERAEGIGDQFVVVPDSHPAWGHRPNAFACFLAVRWFDFRDTGQSNPKNRTLAALLNWSEHAVKLAMAVLRSSGTVETVSTYSPSRGTRKRMIYAPNPTPNPEQSGPGGYENSRHLCEREQVRKIAPCTYEKSRHAPTKNRAIGVRNFAPLNQNSEREFGTKTKTTNQPANGPTGIEESEPGAGGVVVVGTDTDTDTGNPEPQPGAGAGAPPDMAEVVAILAESKLERDEQARYLAVTRRMTEAPPMTWHRHALDVKPTSGTKSLAGVIIARLKAWGTTPADERAAIVESVTAKDAAVIAQRVQSAETWYRLHLQDLKEGRATNPAEVRRSWEQLNAALAAARQPAVLLDNAVLHAEDAERKRAAMPMLTAADMMAAHAAKQEQAAALAPPEPTPAALAEARKKTHGGDRKSQESKCQNDTLISTAEEVEADRQSRIEQEVERRVKAFEGRALMLLTLNSPGNLDAALDHFRTAALPAKRAEVRAEVEAEFAPKLAAPASTPAPPFLAAVHA